MTREHHQKVSNSCFRGFIAHEQIATIAKFIYFYTKSVGNVVQYC